MTDRRERLAELFSRSAVVAALLLFPLEVLAFSQSTMRVAAGSAYLLAMLVWVVGVIGAIACDRRWWILVTLPFALLPSLPLVFMLLIGLSGTEL